MRSALSRRPDTAPRAGFLKSDRGTALVEFAMVLPMMLVLFAVIIESARMLWSYESAIAGVRDATRYLARITPQDICTTHASVDGATGGVTAIVSQTTGGDDVFPVGVTVLSVSPGYSCTSGSFRGSPVAIGSVRATVRIEFPFASLFRIVGAEPGAIEAVISDQARIYGS